jgi:hypothetical protein
MADYAEYFFVVWGYCVGAFLGFFEGVHFLAPLLLWPFPFLVSLSLVAPACGLVGAYVTFRLLD